MLKLKHMEEGQLDAIEGKCFHDETTSCRSIYISCL